MSVPVYMYIEDIKTAMDSYDQIKLFRDTDPAGAFTTEVTGSPVTLVADQRDYSVDDPTGSADYVYRFYLKNSSSSATSAWSNVIRPNGATLAAIRREAARRSGLGSNGTCSSAGTTSTLIDATLLDKGTDTHYMRGLWLYRPGAAAADKLRRISSFNTSNGALTVSRAWADAPDNAESYEVYALFPPYDVSGVSYSWARAVADAMDNCWIFDEVIVGEGNGDDREFDITKNMGVLLPEVNGPVYLRTFEEAEASGDMVREVNLSKRGNFVRWIQNGPNWRIRLPYAPAVSEYIFVEAQRRYEIPHQDTDVTDAPLKLAALATAWTALMAADAYEEGKYGTMLDRIHRMFLAEYSLYNRSQTGVAS